MTVKRLHATDRESVTKYSVIGVYLAESGTGFVKHVAILRDDADLHYASRDVGVWHMGPPLVTGIHSLATAKKEEMVCAAHLVGWVELEAEDMEEIKTWLADVDKENRPSGMNMFRQYIVDPPMKWAEAENKTRLYRRFSCAGYVLECYRSIGIDLIRDADTVNMPETDLETVTRAYGDMVRADWLRDFLGIPGGGPWKIVLAGYVVHALNRTDGEIRQSSHVPSGVAERDYPLPSSSAAPEQSDVPEQRPTAEP